MEPEAIKTLRLARFRMAGRIRLGELLVRASVIDHLRLRAALAQQQKWGGRLGEILVDMGYVSEEVLVRALSQQLGVPLADLEGAAVPESIVRQIGPEFAEQNALCPVRYDPERKVLIVALSDPTDVSVLDALRFRTGLRIEPALAAPSQLALQRPRIMDAGGSDRTGGPLDAIELEDIPAEEIPECPIESNASYVAAMTAAEVELREAGDSEPPTEVVLSPAAGDLIARLDAAQRQQRRALRVLIELLVEKGVFSREDYLVRMTGP